MKTCFMKTCGLHMPQTTSQQTDTNSFWHLLARNISKKHFLSCSSPPLYRWMPCPSIGSKLFRIRSNCFRHVQKVLNITFWTSFIKFWSVQNNLDMSKKNLTYRRTSQKLTKICIARKNINTTTFLSPKVRDIWKVHNIHEWRFSKDFGFSS